MLMLVIACGDGPPDQSRESRGEKVLEQLGRCNAAWNAHDGDSLTACYALGADRVYVAALPETVLEGASTIASNEAKLWRAIKDARRQIEIAIAGPKQLAVAFLVTGTHTGELAGIAATESALSYRVAMWIEFDDAGLITRERVWADATTQHAQLGLNLRRAPPLSESMRDVSVSLASSGTGGEREHLVLFERHNAARHAGDWDGVADTLSARASWRSVNWEGSNEGRERILDFARTRRTEGMAPRTIDTWLAAGPWLAVRFADPFPASDTRDPKVGRSEPGDIMAFFRIEDGQLAERLSFENATRWWANGRGLDPASLRFGGL